jgi:CheY-like chemotaxis protein
LKLAQAAAERANQAKDDFLARLSHELRTPLTPALMVAASLRDDARLPSDARDQLGMMERNIALEARLIDDLLDLTAISRGKLRMRAERCDAHALIALAVEIIHGEVVSKGLRLECDLQATRSGLMVDPARFQQVIWNLLRNAVKFTPPKGSILIRTQDMIPAQGPAWLRIEVEDTGLGIDAAALERIFQPFEQGAAAGDHRFGGVGLGLSIARAIVSLHGGQIRARSDGRMRGAAFIVELPDAQEPPKKTLPQSEAVDRVTDDAGLPTGLAEDGDPPAAVLLRPLRLLLVEDHEPTLEALKTLLERSGHTVVGVGTVSGALAAAERERFDIVISDLGLPDGTGTQLMEVLRESWQLPGIALSGYGMEEDISRCREAGFAAHLVKPVRFADLKAVLDSLTASLPDRT